MLIAAHESFDDDFAALTLRQFECRLDVLACHQIGGYASPVIAIGRLDNHRQADLFRGLPRVSRTVDDPALRNRYAAGLQQALGEVFVSGNALANCAGLISLGGPDAVLTGAVAQLHQIAFGQAYGWNTSVRCRVNDTRSAGSQTQCIDHFIQSCDDRRHIIGFVIHRRDDQLAGIMQRGTTHRFIARAHHNLVNPAH